MPRASTVVTLALVGLVGACGLSVNVDSAALVCEVASQCPSGRMCEEGRCVEPGSEATGTPVVDASEDSEPDPLEERTTFEFEVPEAGGFHFGFEELGSGSLPSDSFGNVLPGQVAISSESLIAKAIDAPRGNAWRFESNGVTRGAVVASDMGANLETDESFTVGVRFRVNAFVSPTDSGDLQVFTVGIWENRGVRLWWADVLGLNELRLEGISVAATSHVAHPNASWVGDGLWHTLVGVYDQTSGAASLYVDGELAGTISSFLTDPLLAGDNLVVGSGWLGAAADATWSWDIDEVFWLRQVVWSADKVASFDEAKND